MTEWRALRGWSPEALRARVDALGTQRNFDAAEEEMTLDRGWHHYSSEAVIAREPEGHACFSRACTALANYQFSDPSIVVAHFDPKAPLLGRRILLEIKVLGLRYLCSSLVSRVREEPRAFGFRYDTLHGHIEQGIEWFLLTKDPEGTIRFRIEARWRQGELPNWWSRVGFTLLSGWYQRRWHVEAHRRLAKLAHGGVPSRARRDRAGLTRQGVRLEFTRHTQRKGNRMNATTAAQIVALGAATGMRSFSAPAALAMRHGGPIAWVGAAMAAGEMAADKMPSMGNRTDPAPLAGRALMGALVGGILARRAGHAAVGGALLGAGVAVAAAHLAFRMRARVPGHTAALAEDAIVTAICAAACPRD